ncbi:MAG TPA: DUF2339 domain-containing protein [Verrucomicrobiae bacterium]|jgi:uncharacterized membrane protein
MEPIIVLIVLVILAVPVAMIILFVKSAGTGDRLDELSRRIGSMEMEMFRLRQERERQESPAPPAPAPKTTTAVPIPAFEPKPTIIPSVPPLKATPPPIVPTKPSPPPFVEEEPVPAGMSAASAATPEFASVPPTIQPAPEPKPAINWEQFMGVKGFAWVGGFALFLGVAFFIKYSFDNNLVPPQLRAAIGFLVGIGLLVGGVVMSRKNFPALSQTLCATGVVILYAVTFACRSVYHFEFFGPLPTFLLMALITTTAFLLAVRLDAMVVAILGMLGGFITPVLLSTGQDNPLGLFGYIAILDAGLIVVVMNKRWDFLLALAAVGTVVMQAGWAGNFFESEKYFEGNKILIALGVLLGFNALWLAANAVAKRRGQINAWYWCSSLGLVAVAYAFTLWFLSFAPLAQRPWLMFGFVFLIDLVPVALALLDENISIGQTVSGLAVFALLGFWTQSSLASDLLNAALVFYLVFAVLHSALPVALQRLRGAPMHNAGNHIFPILSLALVLVPVFKLAEVSFIIWPFILLVDLLAIVLAVLTTALLPILVVLLLTLAATGALIFKIPDDLTGLPTSFFVLAGFAVFFLAVSVWLVKKFIPDAKSTGIKFNDDMASPAALAAVLPACSIVLPFLLLIMATGRLQLANPSPVFGLALLLVVLLLGVTKMFSLDWMPAIGLVCLSALECTWHFNRFNPTDTNQPLNLILAWYLIFLAVFTVFPFLFLKQFSGKVVPWAASAMAALPQFLLVYKFVKLVWPNQFMGLLPAAFAIPGLLGLAIILKWVSADNKSRLAQIAWFGGVALFFITLIFPIQFDRQWITIGWALEGVALLWLFHRVPHPGLRLVGFGLLVAAFVRLALNPAVLEYHARATTPIFNWYLYAYGLVTVSLFVAARLIAPPRNMILKANAQPILAALGTILAFLLLNIEIADFFSEPGSTLTFQFSGNFARDMTYSIAWALFALALLVYGILKNIPAARYSAMGLLCVTLIKLFLHDLAQLGQLYRIGAFIGVAIIAMLASFAYQKFFSARSRQTKPGNEPAQ